MADLMEMAKELGRALQQDERYLAFRAATEANDKDEALQHMIAEFNLLRLNINNEADKETPDTARIDALHDQRDALYNEIMSNQSMIAYMGAKGAFEQLLDGINRVIAFSAAGQDPDNFNMAAAASCSGDCAGCAGCH